MPNAIASDDEKEIPLNSGRDSAGRGLAGRPRADVMEERTRADLHNELRAVHRSLAVWRSRVREKSVMVRQVDHALKDLSEACRMLQHGGYVGDDDLGRTFTAAPPDIAASQSEPGCS